MKHATNNRTERQRIALMAILLFGTVFLTYYFHAFVNTGTVFTHLFYIPIILSALWWKRKGIIVAFLLSALLITSHLYLRVDVGTSNDYLRAVMFIIVGLFVAVLSERISRGEQLLSEEKKKLQHLVEVLRAIRNVNQLIVREHDPERLITEACSILTETRGYSHAWILLTDEAGNPTLTATSGRSEAISAIRNHLRSGTPLPCGTRALNHPEIALVRDRRVSCSGCPVPEPHLGSCSMAMRLASDGKTYGVISVGSPPEIEVDDQEMSLFREMADDIAFALNRRESETRRKKAEADLREEKERAQKYLDVAAVMFVVINADQTVSMVNRKACEILGHPEEEIIGKNWFDHFIPGRIRAEVKTVFSRLLAGEIEPAEYFENPVLNRNGEERIIAWHNTTLKDDQGTIQATLGSGTDITEQLQAEKENIRLETQIRQMQKLEALGTLAGGVAHDFNNILGAIIGYGEMALDDIPDGNPARQGLEQVIKASQRGKSLVRQITTFTRQSEHEKQPVRATPIIEEALQLLRASLPSTITIAHSFQAASDIINADATQIHQVLMNLGANSSHALREKGGMLSASLKNTELDADAALRYPGLRPGTFLQLTVGDTGPGMTPEVMERIFDPYFTTKKPGEGTGMGLAVVLGIVKNHGGAITAYSEPGKGSTFQILLPLVKEIPYPEEDAREPAPGAGRRILFVDDEPDLSEIARQMLGRLGHEVVVQSDGTEALALFRTRPEAFDLVITDQTMPGITGMELARAILSIRPDTPIILCSGFSESATPETIRDTGIKTFLMKPYSRREIAEAIRRAFE